MAKVQLCNITVMDNPTPFLNPFRFEITFKCTEELKAELEWNMIYVGSVASKEYDQILSSLCVNPVPNRKQMFVFEADSPDVSRIPESEAIAATAVIITCLYKNQEFIRVGYFINNEYTDLELVENPPSPPQFDKVSRNIHASQPIVTKFDINWEKTNVQDEAEHGEEVIPGSTPEQEPFLNEN